MKMNKFAAVSALAMVVGFSGQVFAAKDATVNFTARVVNATCDVSATRDNVSMGTHIKADITDITKALSTENLDLLLSNCSDDFDPLAGGAPVTLQATGASLAGKPTLFADNNAKNIGVKLSAQGADLLPNQPKDLNMTQFTAGHSFSIPLIAELMATADNTSIKAQELNVPVTFSIAYN